MTAGCLHALQVTLSGLCQLSSLRRLEHLELSKVDVAPAELKALEQLHRQQQAGATASSAAVVPAGAVSAQGGGPEPGAASHPTAAGEAGATSSGRGVGDGLAGASCGSGSSSLMVSAGGRPLGNGPETQPPSVRDTGQESSTSGDTVCASDGLAARGPDAGCEEHPSESSCNGLPTNLRRSTVSGGGGLAAGGRHDSSSQRPRSDGGGLPSATKEIDDGTVSSPGPLSSAALPASRDNVTSPNSINIDMGASDDNAPESSYGPSNHVQTSGLHAAAQRQSSSGLAHENQVQLHSASQALPTNVVGSQGEAGAQRADNVPSPSVSHHSMPNTAGAQVVLGTAQPSASGIQSNASASSSSINLLASAMQSHASVLGMPSNALASGIHSTTVPTCEARERGHASAGWRVGGIETPLFEPALKAPAPIEGWASGLGALQSLKHLRLASDLWGVGREMALVLGQLRDLKEVRVATNGSRITDAQSLPEWLQASPLSR